MIDILYEFWQWVLSISAVLAVVSGLFAFRDYINKGKIAIRFLANVVVVVAVVMVCLSCIIGMLFAKVPRVYGDAVNEANTKLNATGLEIAFEPGINRDNNWTSQVIGQSFEEGSLVLKGTPVLVYINSAQENAEIKEEDVVNVPQLVGMEQIEATSLLTQNGLQFQVWWTEENNVEAEQYYVVGQSIPEGSTVPKGALIKLELSPNKP